MELLVELFWTEGVFCGSLPTIPIMIYAFVHRLEGVYIGPDSRDIGTGFV
jgi:hypothetical protein